MADAGLRGILDLNPRDRHLWTLKFFGTCVGLPKLWIHGIFTARFTTASVVNRLGRLVSSCSPGGLGSLFTRHGKKFCKKQSS